MGKFIEAHIKIAMIIGCNALFAASFLVGGIPKISAPSAPNSNILGLSTAGTETLSYLSSVSSQMTTSQQILLVLYLIAAVVVAYCLVGLIDSGISYLHDPDLHRIKSYLRKGAYHGYAPQQIIRRLKEQEWDQEKVAKAAKEVFAKA